MGERFSSPNNGGALDGVRIVDMTSILFGAFAAQILGDLGADVIKVEAPGSRDDNGGDIFRYAGRSAVTPGMGPMFMNYNRNKRSVLLDLRSDHDQEALKRLIATADVFIANVRMAGLAKLGFDYEGVRAIRNDIVYVHCAGFGSEGPYANKPAYDDLIQAAAGGSDLLGRADGDPTPRYQPALIADKSSGLYAAYATLAALFHKARTGQGQFVQVPMFECYSHFNLTENLYGRTFDPPTDGLGYARIFNAYRKPYRTLDGYIAIMPYSNEQWDELLELGGLGPKRFSEDPRFADHRSRTANIAQAYAMIEDITLTRTTADWLMDLVQAGIPCMRVARLEDVLDDPHLKAVDFFQRRDHASEGPYLAIRHPVDFSATPACILRDPPRLGEHTEEVLAELGMARS
jgi:crotonobetainyl-CoA:carnitine CoA-transferase CaiB-like acyl-CoA transferase